MCSGSKTKSKPCPSKSGPVMEEDRSEKRGEGFLGKFSGLLEFAASNDLEAFRAEVEEKGLDLGLASFWYGRRIGSKKMAFVERTPLMIAAMFGSARVLKYIVGSGKVDVNRPCGSDKVTALHCAVAGASGSSVECLKVLLEASADPDCVDASGNKPADLIVPALKSLYSSRKRAMEALLGGGSGLGFSDQEEELVKVTEKKEFPVDVSLPDINNGVYMSDEFRMYTFKVKPCSRAYSHDWTECPFVHPGENARRRDPRKYPYTCVPCPEFRKGSCPKGDACEYAHGVFESWLHPAQYRTRLCKDEIGCTRKVCFFAHKLDELRPVYVATGSAMPSPKSMSSSGLDMAGLSPLALGSPSLPMPATSTPPMSPLSASSSPMWQNKHNLAPSALQQLQGSRLKSAMSARDMDLEMELLGLENRYQHQKQQQLMMDEMSGLSSPTHWSREFGQLGQLMPSNLDSAFGSFDPSTLSQLRGISQQSTSPGHLHSPTGVQMRQNMNQLRASYPAADGTSSPARMSSPYGFETSGAVAAAVMNSRSSAFAKRSQSFIDRAPRPGLSAAANSVSMMSSHISDWGAPDGKLDWGLRGDELNKLRKSASFGIRNNSPPKPDLMQSRVNRQDGSWDVQETLPPWVEQMYREQEQMAA